LLDAGKSSSRVPQDLREGLLLSSTFKRISVAGTAASDSLGMEKTTTTAGAHILKVTGKSRSQERAIVME